jgi:hypothetical protein
VEVGKGTDRTQPLVRDGFMAEVQLAECLDVPDVRHTFVFDTGQAEVKCLGGQCCHFLIG